MGRRRVRFRLIYFVERVEGKKNIIMIQTDAALPTFLCVSLSKHSRRVGYMCGSHAINSTGGTGGVCDTVGAPTSVYRRRRVLHGCNRCLPARRLPPRVLANTKSLDKFFTHTQTILCIFIFGSLSTHRFQLLVSLYSFFLFVPSGIRNENCKGAIRRQDRLR